MTETQNRGSLLRQEGEGSHQVTSMELFFDLVYVFAITQLSHLLLEHLDIRGALQTGLLLLAIWWAWIYTAWTTNWLDPNQRPVRLMLIGVMAVSLIVSAVLPEAFGDRGLIFAAAYATMQIGRTLFVVFATREQPGLHRNFQRILAWLIFSGLFWVAGGLASGTMRELLWVGAVLVDVAAPACGFYTPGLGRSTTRDWNISGEHIAERCQLFLIIALGESILVTGATFGELDITPVTLAAFLVAFLGSVALWWVYFDRSAGDAAAAIAQSDDPGALGRSAYTYMHLPMVAGVIVTAVGDELAIAHPLGHASPEIVATVLGGPALFLAGHALFKKAVFGVYSASRLVAIAALGVIAFVGRDWAPLALATSALVILAGVSGWDARTMHYQFGNSWKSLLTNRHRGCTFIVRQTRTGAIPKAGGQQTPTGLARKRLTCRRFACPPMAGDSAPPRPTHDEDETRISPDCPNRVAAPAATTPSHKIRTTPRCPAHRRRGR